MHLWVEYTSTHHLQLMSGTSLEPAITSTNEPNGTMIMPARPAILYQDRFLVPASHRTPIVSREPGLSEHLHRRPPPSYCRWRARLRIPTQAYRNWRVRRCGTLVRPDRWRMSRTESARQFTAASDCGEGRMNVLMVPPARLRSREFGSCSCHAVCAFSDADPVMDHRDADRTTC